MKYPTSTVALRINSGISKGADHIGDGIVSTASVIIGAVGLAVGVVAAAGVGVVQVASITARAGVRGVDIGVQATSDGAQIAARKAVRAARIPGRQFRAAKSRFSLWRAARRCPAPEAVQDLAHADLPAGLA